MSEHEFSSNRAFMLYQDEARRLHDGMSPGELEALAKDVFAALRADDLTADQREALMAFNVDLIHQTRTIYAYGDDLHSQSEDERLASHIAHVEQLQDELEQAKGNEAWERNVKRQLANMANIERAMNGEAYQPYFETPEEEQRYSNANNDVIHIQKTE